MSKPKDRRNEFNRQHARILAREGELQTEIETLRLQLTTIAGDTERPLLARARKAEAELALRQEDLLRLGAQHTALQRAYVELEGLNEKAALYAETATNALEAAKQAHQEEIAALKEAGRADTEQLYKLLDQHLGSMNRKRREAVNAILNRQAVKGLLPGRG